MRAVLGVLLVTAACGATSSTSQRREADAKAERFEAAKAKGDEGLVEFMLNNPMGDPRVQEARKLLKGYTEEAVTTLTWKQLGEAYLGTASVNGEARWRLDGSKIESKYVYRITGKRTEKRSAGSFELFVAEGVQFWFSQWVRINGRLVNGMVSVRADGLHVFGSVLIRLSRTLGSDRK